MFDGANFIDAFADTDATVGLPWGGLLALVAIIVYMLIRVRKQVKEGTYVPVFPAPAAMSSESAEQSEQAATQENNKESEDTSEEEQNDGTTD